MDLILLLISCSAIAIAAYALGCVYSIKGLNKIGTPKAKPKDEKRKSVIHLTEAHEEKLASKLEEM